MLYCKCQFDDLLIYEEMEQSLSLTRTTRDTKVRKGLSESLSRAVILAGYLIAELKWSSAAGKHPEDKYLGR